MEKEKATMRHCKKCDFTSPSPGVMCQHYRHEHPKSGKRLERPARGHYKPHGGQKTSGMGLDAQRGRLERENEGLKINKDADVRHAFNILQTRSNDSNLSQAAQKAFDKLEDETADIVADVSKWPTVVRARVIKLYNEVVNGVTEEK